MRLESDTPDQFFEEYREEELKGFSRSMVSIQWLVMILALLFFFIPTRPIESSDHLVLSMVCYAGFILVFRYETGTAKKY